MASAEEQFSIYLRFEFARAVTNLCIAAIQVVMWAYMISFYIEAPPDTRKRRLPYIVASLVILLLSTSASITEGVYIYNVLFEVAPGPENVEAMIEIHERWWTHLLSPVGLVADLAIRIADAVLVYRCYIVWYDFRVVAALPAAIFLAGLGVSLRTYIPLDFEDRKIDTVDLSLTVGLNILITALILYRLVRAHKRFESALPHTDHKVYMGVVAFVAESAAPAAVFGAGSVLTLPFIETHPGAWKANVVFHTLYSLAVILAPQLIIFRVATGASWVNKSDTVDALSRPIEFTGHGIRTRPDEESSFEEASSPSENAIEPKQGL